MNTAVLSDFSAERNKVLRNTFWLLALTMIPTVLGAFVGMNLSFDFLAGSPILATIGYLVVAFGFIFAIGAARNSPLGIVLLLAFTGFMGITLGPLLQVALSMSNGAQLVGLAAGGAGLIFAVMGSIGANASRDFSSMGKFLFAGVLLLIAASIANLFFQVPVLSLVISAVAIAIFAAYVMYDINQIVTGGETNYVMATLSLYLNVFQIFTNLLRLLMAFNSDD